MGVDNGGEMVLNARVFRTAAENRSGLGMAHREVRVFFDTWACRSGADAPGRQAGDRRKRRNQKPLQRQRT